MILKYEGIYILKGSVETCNYWKIYFITIKGFEYKGFTIS